MPTKTKTAKTAAKTVTKPAVKSAAKAAVKTSKSKAKGGENVKSESTKSAKSAKTAKPGKPSTNAGAKTNAAYSAETQAKLLKAARRDFAKKGYGETSVEKIVSTARVTRGALYHHYEDKRAMFEAVFEELAAELATRIDTSASAAKNPYAALLAGCDAWLDACLDREVQQIVLLDGPSVLGWRRWSEIDAKHSTRRLRAGIDACLEGGLMVDVDPLTLTRLLAGAMNDVALLLAEAKDAVELRRETGHTLHAVLNGLRTPRRF